MCNAGETSRVRRSGEVALTRAPRARGLLGSVTALSGAAVVAGAGEAWADVVYTPLSETITASHAGTYSFALSGNTLKIETTKTVIPHPVVNSSIFKISATRDLTGPEAAGVAVAAGGRKLIASGYILPFVFTSTGKVVASTTTNPNTPAFTDKYLGFQFPTAGGTGSGWLEASLTYAGAVPELSLLGYAYDTTPGETFLTGQTSGPTGPTGPGGGGGPTGPGGGGGTTSVPEPASAPVVVSGLAALALGAAGTRAWRRARAAV